MPVYHQLGQLPDKKHITFYNSEKKLYREELFSTLGFSGMYSTLYRINMPTANKSIVTNKYKEFEVLDDEEINYYHVKTNNIEKKGDILSSRKTIFYNSDVTVSLAEPSKPQSFFYKNAKADELLFVHNGSGKLISDFGVLEFKENDYLVIPKGIIYQMEFDSWDNNKLLVIESFSQIVTPKRYRNNFGQFLEHSPYCERDIRKPHDLITKDESGDFLVKIKYQDKIVEMNLDHHPFDVVGLDGYIYPWALSINDFNPIVGKIHQPPPVHQTFEANNFVICSFVPRLYDFHPQAIPAPYYHSNIDSDELIYYVKGNFMSRKGIEESSITMHPAGLPHGPQPGKTEASLGKKSTDELAVMVDTFKPLNITKLGKQNIDIDYHKSWLD